MLEAYKSSIFERLYPTDLNCCYNDIEKLPDLPHTLKYLKCDSNQLYSLPKLPNLITLICDGNNLTRLRKLPDTLKILYCGSNQLNTLPRLPNLEELSFPKNRITRVKLPDSLKYLNCRSNKIVNLKIPTHLQVLYCDNNLISSLVINDTLQHLECSNNKITQITLNEQISQINISHNRIVKLPILPKSILTLNIRATDIHDCFEIPPQMEYLFLYGTPVYHKLQSFLNTDEHISDPKIIKSAFETIQSIEKRFRYAYYCLKLKERMMTWLWRSRENIAIKKYHPDNLIEWLSHHDYDTLDHW